MLASGAVIENSEKPQSATTLQRVQNPQQNDPRKETPKSVKSLQKKTEKRLRFWRKTTRAKEQKTEIKTDG